METNEKIVAPDTVVQIAYNLQVNGEEVESNNLEYLHGHQNILDALEGPLTGMKVGEVKKVHIAAADGYGLVDENMIIPVDRNAFPKDFEIKLGEPMHMRDNEGHVYSGVAIRIDEKTVTVDLNHPMAGKDMDFKVSILDVRPATEIEIAAGHLGGCSCSCDDDSCGDGCCSDSGCCH